MQRYKYSIIGKDQEVGLRCMECEVCFVKESGHKVLCVGCFKESIDPKYPICTEAEIEPDKYSDDIKYLDPKDKYLNEYSVASGFIFNMQY